MTVHRGTLHLAERLTPPFAYHGEGPFWDWRANRLMCVDVLAGVVVAIDSAGGLHQYPVPSRAATVIRRRTRGGFIVASEHGLLLADDELEQFEHLAEIVGDPAVRTNDGGCDPFGGFIIGTMSY